MLSLMRRRSGFAIFLIAIAGCGSEQRGARRDSRSSTVACHVRPGQSRWAGDYRASARYGGNGQQWLHEIGGTAFRDSLLFVYDTPEGKILVLTADLRPLSAFGRRGNGPGEFTTLVDRGMRGLNWRWLGVSGDTLMVFDGVRIQLFGTTGRFLNQQFTEMIGTPSLNPMNDRIAYSSGHLIRAEGG